MRLIASGYAIMLALSPEQCCCLFAVSGHAAMRSAADRQDTCILLSKIQDHMTYDVMIYYKYWDNRKYKWKPLLIAYVLQEHPKSCLCFSRCRWMSLPRFRSALVYRDEVAPVCVRRLKHGSYYTNFMLRSA